MAGWRGGGGSRGVSSAIRRRMAWVLGFPPPSAVCPSISQSLQSLNDRENVTINLRQKVVSFRKGPG